jgi:hypothetical protein
VTGFVPPSTSIRRSRVRNIDTDRLRNRRAYVIAQFAHAGKHFESRHDFAMRALELRAIETELINRNHLPATERRTLP